MKEQFYDPSNIGHFMPTSSESNKLNVFLYFRNQSGLYIFIKVYKTMYFIQLDFSDLWIKLYLSNIFFSYFHSHKIFLHPLHWIKLKRKKKKSNETE